MKKQRDLRQVSRFVTQEGSRQIFRDTYSQTAPIGAAKILGGGNSY